MKKIIMFMVAMMLITSSLVFAGVATGEITGEAKVTGKNVECDGFFDCLFKRFSLQAMLDPPRSINTKEKCEQTFRGKCGTVTSWTPPYAFFGFDLKWNAGKQICEGTVYTQSEQIYRDNCGDPYGGGSGGGNPPPDECESLFVKQCKSPGSSGAFLSCEFASQGNTVWKDRGESCSSGLVCNPKPGTATGITCDSSGGSSGSNSCTSNSQCRDWEICGVVSTIPTTKKECGALGCGEGYVARNHQCEEDRGNWECTKNSECNDNNACTSNLCNAQTHICEYPAITSGSCGSPTVECNQNSDCDDGVECTTNSCVSNKCDYKPTSSCGANTGNPGCKTASDCDDGNEFTVDRCVFVGSQLECSNKAEPKCGDNLCDPILETANSCEEDCATPDSQLGGGDDNKTGGDDNKVDGIVKIICGEDCDPEQESNVKTSLIVAIVALIFIIFIAVARKK